MVRRFSSPILWNGKKRKRNHGNEPQSKLRGIVPSALRDCSTYQFQRVTLGYTLELEVHNKKEINIKEKNNVQKQ